MIEVIPAILAKSREELFSLAALVHEFAQTIQLDVVDGLLDDDLAWPYRRAGEIEDFSRLRLPYLDSIFWEVHLMMQSPQELALRFIESGASRIIAHIEAFKDADAARDAFDEWHAHGAQVGIVLMLATPISAIEDIVHDVEMVQVMGIEEIGAQGHSFDERALARVRELRERFPHIIISVDGGVNAENAHAIAVAGANRLAVGSAIIRSENPKAAYEAIARAV